MSRESTRVVVSEDPFVSSFLRAMLRRRGYEVLSVHAEQAIRMILSGDVEPGLVITNQPEVFLPVARMVPMLYIAAAPDPAMAARFPRCRVLSKPFHNDALIAVVEFLTRC